MVWNNAAKERINRSANERARPLIYAATRAAHQIQGRSYGRYPGELDECLTLLRDASQVLGSVLDQTAANDKVDGGLDRGLAKQLGRALAQGIHVSLHNAWRAGQNGTTTSPRRAVLVHQLKNFERSYRERLLASRYACLKQRPDLLQGLLDDLNDEAFGKLSLLTQRVASLSNAERDKAALGLRVTRLGRKTAMLAAGLILLTARLSTRRTSGSTAKIAESRKKLTRDQPQLRIAKKNLANAQEGDRIRIRGRIKEVEWTAGGDKMFSRLTLEGVDSPLYVHYKNLERLGVQAGMAVWAAGKVEEVSGQTAVIVEFEGPGQHEGEYWEDWLANKVRRVYDLYPQSLFMDWEYPPADGKNISVDVRCRIGHRNQEEA
jgi:hypothetical protein